MSQISSLRRRARVFLILLILCVTSCGGAIWSLSDPLPIGREGAEAEVLADRILSAVNAGAAQHVEGAKWRFAGHTYLWHVGLGRVRVDLDDDERVYLSLGDPAESRAYLEGLIQSGGDAQALIQEAVDAFNNDSFWVFAPLKVRDEGTIRAQVDTPDGPALLVKYSQGGSTPGDQYLWHLDESGRPIKWQMWVQIIPIGGLSATWEDWRQTQSGLWIAHRHTIAGIELVTSELAVTQKYEELGENDPIMLKSWPFSE